MEGRASGAEARRGSALSGQLISVSAGGLSADDAVIWSSLSGRLRWDRRAANRAAELALRRRRRRGGGGGEGAAQTRATPGTGRRH